MLYRVFVTVGGLIVLALFTALIAPLLIDWSAYKEDFEREASLIAGQPVRVGGGVKLRVLPLPSVSFENLEVGENADGSPLMTVERFSLNAELMPFLSGEVRIVDMTMVRPQVNLEVEENGMVAWTDRKEPLVDPGRIKLDRLDVKDASIAINGLANGRAITFENVQAKLSANSLLGPWRIEANGLFEGKQAEFRISTGSVQDSGAVRVRIEAEQDEQPYRLILDGPVRLEEQVLNWRGDFQISPLVGDSAFGHGEALPIMVEGKFDGSPEAIAISEYRLEAGPREDPYTITGDGMVTFRDQLLFKLTADGRQIDLDRIGNVEENKAGVGIGERIGALRSVLERIPVPTIDGQIDIVLPAIVAGDTLIREISANVKPHGTGWAVRSLSAILPGNTKIEAAGRLGLREDFGFDGNLTLASRQPTGFAAWVAGEVDPAFRKLNSAGITARVSLSHEQILLEEMEMILDQAIMNGTVHRLLSDDGSSAIIANLEGEKIVLDDLRAIYSLVGQSDNSQNARQDFDVQIAAKRLEGTLAGKGFAAREVDTHLQVHDGAVSINRLNAQDFFGAEIKSSGRIENVFAKPNGNMKLSVKAKNGQGLLSLASRYLEELPIIARLRSNAEFTKNTKLEIEFDTTTSGDQSKGQVLLKGVSGGTTINLRTSFDGGFDQLEGSELNINLMLSNLMPASLLRQIGFETLPIDVDGPMVINVEAAGVPNGELATLIAIDAPGTNLAAHGTMTTNNGHDYFGEMNLTLGSRDFTPWLQVSGFQLPGIGLDEKMPISATVQVDHQSTVTKFNSLSGQVGGNNFTGDAVLVRDGLERPLISGNLDIDKLSFPSVAAGVLGLDVSLLSAEEGALWSTAEFGKSFYDLADAKFNLVSKQADLGGGIIASNATGKLEVLNGAVNFSQFRLNVFGGELETSLGLKNIEGTASGDLRYQVKNLGMRSILELVGLPDIAEGRLSTNGSIQASGKSVAGMISASSGDGVMNLNGGKLTGMDPNGFSELLAKTDVDNFDVTPEVVAALVREFILRNRMDIGDIENAFTISQGRLNLRNLRTETLNSDLTGNVAIGLMEGQLEAEAAVRFDPGKEAIVGADPEIGLSWLGSLDQPETKIDTGLLEGYLSLRAFERSQRRVEMMEASVLETQRLSREIQLARAKELYRERKEEERRLLEEQLRLEREAEEARKVEAARKAEEARITEEEHLAEELRKTEDAEADLQSQENTDPIIEAIKEQLQAPTTVPEPVESHSNKQVTGEQPVEAAEPASNSRIPLPGK